MCIVKSVGLGARNDNPDVRVVQKLLNLHRARLVGAVDEDLEVDGQIGAKTIRAIQAFETRVMGLPTSDGIVAPGDATVRALLQDLPPGLSADKMQLVMPLATRKRIELYFPHLVGAMDRYGITSPLQVAHFIAQLAHESGFFLYAEELASGAAYEGRADLGNTEPGDGVRFKGRGLIQLTGRNNYRAYSRYTGQDFIAHPERLAAEAPVSVDVSCWFWVDRKIGPSADADDVKAVTYRINGGYNHLDARMENLQRTKALLGLN